VSHLSLVLLSSSGGRTAKFFDDACRAYVICMVDPIGVSGALIHSNERRRKIWRRCEEDAVQTLH
jgi:hypothetical protein